jgi:hypothetical protein
MLRHLSAGDRDEALDGDLLEVFRLGRSNAWYWRQVAAACAVSWCDGVTARWPALAFALLWSMLAPVWDQIVDKIEALPVFDRIWQIIGPLWLLIALVGWIALHAAFLWAGLLVYRFAHTFLGKSLHHVNFRRGFWISALVFPPAAGLIFLVANLYWYSLPGLAHARLAASPWRQISDLGILANLIRIPYFVALAIGLWGTSRPVRQESAISVGSVSDWTPSDPDATSVTAIPQSAAVQRFLALMVGAGLVNSLIVAFLLCRLPDTHSIDLASVFVSALKFVTIGAVGGIIGSWLYWQSPSSPLRQGSPVPFSVFALTCAAGWMWIPAMVLLGEQVSASAALVAMVGAFVLAMGLRTATYFVFVPAERKVLRRAEGDLFAESLYQSPVEPYGYIIALGVFAAGAALENRSNYTAALLLAMSAFIFAWKNTIPRRQSLNPDAQLKRAMSRLARAAVPAILLTMCALIDGMAHRNQDAEASAASAADPRAGTHVSPNPKKQASSGAGGFQSVVLWPYPAKKEIVPPLVPDDSILPPGSRKPLIIRFDGPYWFLQPPEKKPGPEAHVARGTPVNVDIAANNAIELVMDAHQKLSRPIRTARCSDIEIEVENRDNRAGLVSVGLLLTEDDDSSPKRTLYLGQQPVVSTEPSHFFAKMAPLHETLRFAVPPHPTLGKFNEITVMFLPDIEHTFVAPKIAIQQFELYPR